MTVYSYDGILIAVRTDFGVFFFEKSQDTNIEKFFSGDGEEIQSIYV